MTTRQMTYVATVLYALGPLAMAAIAGWAFALSDAWAGVVLSGFAVVLAVLAVRDIRRAWRRQWEHEAKLRLLAQEARERWQARRDAT